MVRRLPVFYGGYPLRKSLWLYINGGVRLRVVVVVLVVVLVAVVVVAST